MLTRQGKRIYDYLIHDSNVEMSNNPDINEGNLIESIY